MRPGTQLGPDVHLGNFVETKKTVIGRGSKANHLSYLGDTTIGEKVNVGAGTITCNYDGYKKFQTVIEDGAFIGSDSQLVAPVRDREARGGRRRHDGDARRAGGRAGAVARAAGRAAGLRRQGRRAIRRPASGARKAAPRPAPPQGAAKPATKAAAKRRRPRSAARRRRPAGRRRRPRPRERSPSTTKAGAKARPAAATSGSRAAERDGARVDGD